MKDSMLRMPQSVQYLEDSLLKQLWISSTSILTIFYKPWQITLHYKEENRLTILKLSSCLIS